jgi:hypothetical protein
MADRLNVTDLDFDTLKANLKTFLKQQSEFSDYDFEGAGLNVLLDILAYNTHYNSYYLNMLANESFLDSSILRNSVVSHAKRFGYTPRSASAPLAKINFSINSLSSTPGSVTLPEGYIFLSNLIDSKSYNFITLEDTTVSKTGNNFVFTNLEIYEGQLATYSFTHVQSSNPKQIFTLPDINVDTSTIKVSVRESISNLTSTVYTLNTDAFNVDSTSEVYYIQEGQNNKYEIYFGNNVLGKKIPDGSIVSVKYLITNGDLANKANSFIATATVSGYSTFTVNSTLAASGGSPRETVDQIKFAAPLQFTSQNRAVTKNDYIKLIQQKYPQFEAVNVWGGEENDPPIFGKVFISAKPKQGFEVTDAEKEFVKEKIIKPISILTVTPEIVDVDYNFLKLIARVYYDPTKTISNTNTLKSSVQTEIENYCDNNLNTFNSIFKSSILSSRIDNLDNAIQSNQLELFLTKKFRPDLVNSNSYVLDYGVPLQKGTTSDNLYSNPEFTILDEEGISRQSFLEEVPSSFTGVESITVTNPGINYMTTPTVEIIGDGQGATAIVTIVNSKISKVTVTNPGVGYTTATVRITGGGGQLGAASAVLEGRYGQLRTVYYKPDEVTNENTKVILNYGANFGVMGSIDYYAGKIYINNFNPTGVANDFAELSVNIRPEISVISSQRNKMLAFDNEDPTSVIVEMNIL